MNITVEALNLGGCFHSNLSLLISPSTLIIAGRYWVTLTEWQSHPGPAWPEWWRCISMNEAVKLTCNICEGTTDLFTSVLHNSLFVLKMQCAASCLCIYLTSSAALLSPTCSQLHYLHIGLTSKTFCCTIQQTLNTFFSSICTSIQRAGAEVILVANFTSDLSQLQGFACPIRTLTTWQLSYKLLLHIRTFIY